MFRANPDKHGWRRRVTASTLARYNREICRAKRTCSSRAGAFKLQMASHGVHAARWRGGHRRRRLVACDRRHVGGAHLSRARRPARRAMVLGCPDRPWSRPVQQWDGERPTTAGKRARLARRSCGRSKSFENVKRHQRPARNEASVVFGRAAGVDVAGDRFRFADKSRRYTRDHSDNGLRSGLDKDSSPVRAVRGAHQDQTPFRIWKSPRSFWFHFELDHRIPPRPGGRAVRSSKPRIAAMGRGREKDRSKPAPSRAVCAGSITLDEARRRIWADWRAVGKVCQ